LLTLFTVKVTVPQAVAVPLKTGGLGFAFTVTVVPVGVSVE
jgi:hypothetical protein